MKKEVKENLSKELDEQIEMIVNEGINIDNIESLYKLIDMHKDLANEDYWDMEKEEIKNEIQRL